MQSARRAGISPWKLVWCSNVLGSCFMSANMTLMSHRRQILLSLPSDRFAYIWASPVPYLEMYVTTGGFINPGILIELTVEPKFMSHQPTVSLNTCNRGNNGKTNTTHFILN